MTMQAIFLSYASQDADAARRICEALRATGLEVWFDQSELRGGDAWDASIRKQIRECAIFVPVITPNTQAREEGYFRLEWKLAVDRSHLMADNKAFLMPVLLGDVHETSALVPDKFRERQWSRLNDDAAIAEFTARVAKLIAGRGSQGKNALEAAPMLATTPFAPVSARVADEGFWVAVLPFRHRGSNPDLVALAEGISEDVVTGLTRFSYLRVIARGATLAFSGDTVDVRTAGNALGARYVIEGSLRGAGASLRVSVQLVDVHSGATLWAETYERPFKPEDVFALQDDLVPRIVSTIADSYGVLAHSMSSRLRDRAPELLTPYEAVLRSFGYMERLTSQDHAVTRELLERAVEKAPDNADCWAMLSQVILHELTNGFNPLPDSGSRVLAAARRAVAAGPSNHLAYLYLAWALHYNDEREASRHAAERALALNPVDASASMRIGMLIAFTGDWEKGCALVERARQLNPNHPGFYWIPLTADAYRRLDYRGALEAARKINMPGYFYTNMWFACAHAQLGEREAAAKALSELLAQRPDFALIARSALSGFGLSAEMVEHIVEGLRKAGLRVPASVAVMQNAATENVLVPAAEANVSIAVLAFANRSASADDEYFSDGLADELLSVLAKIKGLRVAARTSAFSFKGKSATVAEIGHALSVQTVLEGSVRKSGNRARIAVQLIKVADGYHLWSETYDRTLDDIFAVQDDIAQSVVAALRKTLLGTARDAHAAQPVEGEISLASAGRSENSEAYALYLKARFLVGRMSQADVMNAVSYLEAALKLDSNFARGYAALAHALVQGAVYGVFPIVETVARARREVQRALRLAPDLVDAHLALGHIRMHQDWDWEAAEASLACAHSHAPGNAAVLQMAGYLLTIRGRYREAVGYFERAISLDPLNAQAFFSLSLLLDAMGDSVAALDAVQEALKIAPDGVAYRYLACLVLLTQKRIEEAIALAQGDTTEWSRLASLAVLNRAAGRVTEAESYLQALIRGYGDIAGMQVAMSYAASGEIEATFKWLEHAYVTRDAGITLLLPWSHHFEAVQSDPRWTALLKKMRLVD